MKRKSIVFLLIVLLFSFCFAGCEDGKGKSQMSVSVQTDQIVLYCIETEGNETLIDAMASLQESGKLQYAVLSGMVTELNGKANTANSYWMLYTSDAELSNTAWGTIEYEGKTLGSAIVGAEALTVEKGEYYVWVYQTF